MQPGVVYRGPQPAAQGYYVFGKSEWYFRDTYQFLLTHNPGGPGARYYSRGQIPIPLCEGAECENKNRRTPEVLGFGEGDGRELYAVLNDRTLRRIVVR